MQANPSESRLDFIRRARAAKMTFQSIGDILGISHERVRQLHRKALTVPTPSEFDGLSSPAKGLLKRLGYTSRTETRAAIAAGKIGFGCIFGMGRHRIAEIEAWAFSERPVSGSPTQPTDREEGA